MRKLEEEEKTDEEDIEEEDDSEVEESKDKFYDICKTEDEVTCKK